MKTVIVTIGVILLLLLAAPWYPVQAGPPAQDGTGSGSSPESFDGMSSSNTISASLAAELQQLPPGEMLSVIVRVRNQVDTASAAGADAPSAVGALQARSRTSQARLKDWLVTRREQSRVAQVTHFWVFNGMTVTATPDVIRELAQQPEVISITPNAVIHAPQLAEAASAAAPNLEAVGAPLLWQEGFMGQGVVVATMDSGVDISHPDLAVQWRGGTNSWFDPNGEHPEVPYDALGHGTWTMGVLLGRDSGGTAVGVAPEAQWISAKIFDDSGVATTAGIHAAFQWLLDPDGDPATSDAPDVVSSSWSFDGEGCNLEFQDDLRALRAAGILPIFSAGNAGPDPGTDRSPANYPEAFSVGAVDNEGHIYIGSSRGPSRCGKTAYPDVVAPGVNIRTTGLEQQYFVVSGTSLSAPHVAGGLALLLSAYPDMSVAEQEAALLDAALDLGEVGVDDTYGYGELDLLAAREWLAARPAQPGTLPVVGPVPDTDGATQGALMYLPVLGVNF